MSLLLALESAPPPPPETPAHAIVARSPDDVARFAGGRVVVDQLTAEPVVVVATLPIVAQAAGAFSPALVSPGFARAGRAGEPAAVRTPAATQAFVAPVPTIPGSARTSRSTADPVVVVDETRPAAILAWAPAFARIYPAGSVIASHSAPPAGVAPPVVVPVQESGGKRRGHWRQLVPAKLPPHTIKPRGIDSEAIVGRPTVRPVPIAPPVPPALIPIVLPDPAPARVDRPKPTAVLMLAQARREDESLLVFGDLGIGA